MKSAALGQNFLVNRGVAEKIVDSFFPSENSIIEVGPGEGVLTKLIIERKKGETLNVVELDPAIVEKIKNMDGVDFLLHRDVLETNPPADLEGDVFSLISNVPYYISKDFIAWLIRWRHVIRSGVLMFQKEFVDKLLKKKGSPQAVAFELLFDSEKIMNVMPGSFSPPPKVVSSVMKFRSSGVDMPAEEADKFISFLTTGFAKRRKTLMNNLAVAWNKADIAVAMDKNNISGSARAEDLEAAELLKIFTFLTPGSIDNPA